MEHEKIDHILLVIIKGAGGIYSLKLACIFFTKATFNGTDEQFYL